MKPLLYIFVGATAATVLLLVAIARRGAPAPLTPAHREHLDRYFGGDQLDQWTFTSAGEHVHEWTRSGTLGSQCLRCGKWLPLMPPSTTTARTAELATGGGQEGAGR